MHQSRPKPPQAYGMFSNTALLVTAIDDLQHDIKTGPITRFQMKMDNIKHLIFIQRKLSQNPFVEAGYAAQDKLIRVLIDCLNPEKAEIATPALLPKGKTVVEANAETRRMALVILSEIDNMRDDSGCATMSCMGNLNNALGNIILNPRLDQPTLEAYHQRLIGWPNFIQAHGRSYGAILETLFNLSNKRCDEMTMGWVRRSALPELERVMTLGSGGSKPASTPA